MTEEITPILRYDACKYFVALNKHLNWLDLYKSRQTV